MFIRTPRLFLRPAWIEDARALATAIADWDIVRNLSRAPWPYTVADAEYFLKPRMAMAAAPHFLVFARTDGEAKLVGSIALDTSDDGDPAELGYWIARDAWGRGYATEAGRAVLKLAFDGLRLPAVEAGHFLDNPASGAVLRKLGFTPTGAVSATPCRARGAVLPIARYRLSRAEWSGRMPLCLAA